MKHPRTAGVFSKFGAMMSPVRKMFDEIAARYDFLNHALSCFQDILWRRSCCREIRRQNPGGRLLDLCGGTGDFAATYEKLGGKPAALRKRSTAEQSLRTSPFLPGKRYGLCG